MNKLINSANLSKINKQFNQGFDQSNRLISSMLMDISFSGYNREKKEITSLNSVVENCRNPVKSMNLSEFAYQLANV